MAKVPEQLLSVCLDLQDEISQVVDEAQLGLELRIMHAVDQKVPSLETKMEVWYNEARQETISTL